MSQKNGFTMVNNDKWFEVWYSQGEDILPDHLLIVTADSRQLGSFVVLDPKKHYEVVYKGSSYDETAMWLAEDEYIRVTGRELYDDGW